MIKLPESKNVDLSPGYEDDENTLMDIGFNRCLLEIKRLNATAQPVSDGCKVPEGWKLVPIEPTEDMLIHGFESEPDEIFSSESEWEEYEAMSGCQKASHRALLCWAAMLSAVPEFSPPEKP